MNFNVYVPKKIGQQLNKITKELHCSRNSILVAALTEWLEKHQTSKWPKGFFDFEPVEDVPDFKALRSELVSNRKEDPLA